MANYTKAKNKAEKAYKDYTDEVSGESVDQLKKRVVSLRFHQAEVENFVEELKERPDIKTFKDAITEAFAPSTDTLKAIKIKSDYLIAMIDEKGGDVSGVGNS